MSGLFWTALHQQIAHRNQYRLAILIQSGHPHLDQPKVRTRLRWPHLEHFALNVQIIAWSHRTRPAQLIEAGSDYPACRPELAVDQEAHGHGSSVPTARYQTLKYRVLRCRGVEMERLGIELRSKALDPLLVNLESAGAIRLPHRKVFEIPLGHSEKSSATGYSANTTAHIDWKL